MSRRRRRLPKASQIPKKGEKCQLACKPGSVWLRLPGTWQPFIWDDACAPPLATHPDGWPGNGPDACACAPSLFGLAPGGVCHAVSVARSAVGSYPTFSPLPGKPGGSFSVALSLGSPPPDVIRRRVSVEPGLSSPCGLSTMQSAAARPTGRHPLDHEPRNGKALKRIKENAARNRRTDSHRRRSGHAAAAQHPACRSRPNSLPPPRSHLPSHRSTARTSSRSRDSWVAYRM
jgi:hypothetical protein